MGLLCLSAKTPQLPVRERVTYLQWPAQPHAEIPALRPSRWRWPPCESGAQDTAGCSGKQMPWRQKPANIWASHRQRGWLSELPRISSRNCELASGPCLKVTFLFCTPRLPPPAPAPIAFSAQMIQKEMQMLGKAVDKDQLIPNYFL